jgi:hypothetical protein
VIIAIYHTQRHTHIHTFGRTRLDEGPARRRGLYLHYTQHSQETNIHSPGGIRTRDPSKRAPADLRLRSVPFQRLKIPLIPSPMFSVSAPHISVGGY